MSYVVKRFKENEIDNCGIDTDKIIDIIIRHYPKLNYRYKSIIVN